jgi:hypothetical protein
VTIEVSEPCGCRSRSYRTIPSSTMSTVHVTWACAGYACWVKRAWNTSLTPGTAGLQARTSSGPGGWAT